jgi:hypothetical protein
LNAEYQCIGRLGKSWRFLAGTAYQIFSKSILEKELLL